MANLKGLASIVSELRIERTNLASQLERVDAALSVLRKLNGGSFYTKPRRTLSASARRRISRAQKARWGKAKRSRAETQAHHVGVGPQDDRSGTAGTVGEASGEAEGLKKGVTNHGTSELNRTHAA